MLSPNQISSLKKGAKVLRALNHPVRQKILAFIHPGFGGRYVAEIQQHLNLDQPKVSAHLKILRDEKLVTTKRDGSRILYEDNTHLINFVCNKVQEFSS